MRVSKRPMQRTVLFCAALVLLSFVTNLGARITSAQPSSGNAVRLEGEIEVVYEDSHNRGGQLLYFLNADRTKLELRFANNPPRLLRTGMHVAVRGKQVGETVELNSGADVNVSSTEVSVTDTPMGQHRVLVVLVNFQDKQTQPFTREQAQSVMFGTTNDYYRESSYGQTWLTGDVYGWYTIPVSSSSCDTTAISNYAQQAAAAAGANLGGYDHLVYAFPQNACTWQGRGSVGGRPSQAWVNEWFELGIVGHELGHNFGLYHSRSMDCGSVPIGGTCTTDEYGDVFDLMGGADHAHFNLFQKERLGWINSGTNAPLTTVTTSGGYWLDRYEETTMTSKGLKILKSTDPVTGEKTWYYVEFRSAFGFDSFLNGNVNVTNGVIIRTGSDSSGQNTYLLDMTPTTSSWYDPALTVGLTFADADAGIQITTVSTDATGALVNVSLGGQQCVRANPTLSLSPAKSPWMPSGATATFNVILRNNDGIGCQAAGFSWQSAIPVGWSASALPMTVLSPGDETNITFQVTSPAATADGFYDLNLSVGNGSYSTSAAATYSLVSALSVTNTVSQATYARNQTATVTTTVKAAGTPASGASVTFTMTKSNGTTVSSTMTAGTNGVAVFKYSFNRKKDPTGTYQVRAQANSNGVSGSNAISFVVK